MDSGNFLQSVRIPPLKNLDWSIGGAGDFNNDDNADILWRNDNTGQNAVWLMDNTTFTRSVPLLALKNPDWQIVT